MRKSILIILTLISSIHLYAQIFAPEGATWYYSYDPDVTLDDGYQKIEVAGDTIINNKTCKVLQITNIGYSYFYQDYYNYENGKIFMYEEDSVVYYKKDSLFYVLYDFSEKVGASYYSIGFSNICTEQYEIKIDSISTTSISEVALKKFHITINDSVQSSYIEKVGFSHYLIPLTGIGCTMITGPHYPGPLRCYSDNETGTISTGVTPECDFITSSGTKKLPTELITVYPNPASNNLTISTQANTNLINIEITNLTGKRIYRMSKINSNKIDLNIEKYTPGIYFLKIESSVGISNKKFVVE